MAFVTKTWVDRISEHPNRRLLSPTGTTNTYDVTRDEGTVTRDGDAFSAANMNNLESRISNGFEEAASLGQIVTFLSSDWVADSGSGDFVCTKTGISRVTATSNLVVSPASTAEDMASWSKFGIYASEQAAGSVTFRAKKQPGSTVQAQVLVLG